jgi:hypothetical protein
MNCREGCKTKDHSSYAECLQSANVTITATVNSPMQKMYEKTKSDLSAFREAASHGIMPEGTTKEKVDAAKAATKALGRPYNAQKDPPTSMITTKKAAAAVNRLGADS